MATGYIVWNSVERRFVAGPFLTSADASSYANRAQKKTEGRLTDKSSKTAVLTVETVTLN